MRLGLAAILFLLLQACSPVSYSHISSKESLDKGLEARNAAEKSAMAFSEEKVPTNLKGTLSLQDTSSLPSARLALAEDARRDYNKAVGPWTNASRADRISALLRSGQKMWFAGRAADLSLASKIAFEGKARCGKVTEFRPDRDCALIQLMPFLTVLQYHRDGLLDLEIERKSRNSESDPAPAFTDAQAIEQTVSIVMMNKESVRLAGAPNEGRADIERFVKFQQITYWCAAVDAMARFTRGPDSGRQETRGRAKALLTGTASPEAINDLTAGLQGTGVSVESANGAYVDYTRRIFRMAGVNSNNTASVTDHKAICNRLRPTT